MGDIREMSLTNSDLLLYINTAPNVGDIKTYSVSISSICYIYVYINTIISQGELWQIPMTDKYAVYILSLCYIHVYINTIMTQGRL